MWGREAVRIAWFREPFYLMYVCRLEGARMDEQGRAMQGNGREGLEECPRVSAGGARDAWRASFPARRICPQGDATGGVLYGYARVSARDQRLTRQFDALRAFGVAPARVFADKASGKDFKRPAWRELVARLRPGDTVVVTSIDRLGRNYDEILAQWRLLTRERGAAIVVLDMPLLDTRRAASNVTSELIADIVLQLLSYVAHVEREHIRQRQAEGIASARARGVHLGRPRKERPSQYASVCQEFERGCLTRSAAAARLGVCPGTFDRWRREDARACASACL